MKFKYTIIYVENVPETLRFYESALGFKTGFIHESNDYGELITGETKLAFGAHTLQTYLGKTSVDADPARPCYEIAFETDDVEGAVHKAVEAGAIVQTPVTHAEWGQAIAYVSDPNGVLVEICSPME